MVQVTNTQRGIRGLNAVDGYKDLAPGQTIDVELTDDERKNAESTGYFAFGAKAAKAAAEAANPNEPEPLPNNVPKLKKLAKDEGIDVGDAKSAADLQAAITAGRAAKAAGGIPPVTPPADDLDNMADDNLRVTVAALTGKPVEDYADTSREDLLKLARGQ